MNKSHSMWSAARPGFATRARVAHGPGAKPGRAGRTGEWAGGAVAVVLVIFALLALVLAGCNSPQPLPVAPTPIPTLPPATLPPAVQPTSPPELSGISFPSAPPSAPDGAAIFSANCATCHGADGTGVVEGSRNFNDAAYMRTAAPADFYASVTNGKGKMPSFKDQLSDGDRWNVVYYLWHWSVPEAALAEGDKVYQANCVSCHGADGTGAIPQAPNFTNVQFISSYPASVFFEAVTGGKGIMPAWQSRLTDAERWAAVERVRTFAYQPATGGAQPSIPAEQPTQAPPPTQPPAPTAEPPPTQAPAPTTAPPPTEAPAATQAPAAAAPVGNAATGQQLWASKPCMGCHGPNAEGLIGPKLAGITLSFNEVLQVVRNGKGGGKMPAFNSTVITDQELADIYAWLETQ
jgi:mono/diheme cytochrome c family protein